MQASDELVADSTDDLELIRAAASEAAAIAMGFFRTDPEVWMKDGQSPVSEADIAVDRFLLDTLTKARPDYGWLSEETLDNVARLARPRTFVVDPIDGTRAFIDGRDRWCVSVAVVENGRSVAGVLDCPVRGEVFTARSGGGAERNGKAIAVSMPGEGFDIGGPRRMLDKLPGDLRALVRPASYVPSLAYRLAMVADGRLSASLVKPNAHDWDIAAAELILREAGGRLADETGQTPFLAGKDHRLGKLAAGSGPLLERLTEAMAEM